MGQGVGCCWLEKNTTSASVVFKALAKAWRGERKNRINIIIILFAVLQKLNNIVNIRKEDKSAKAMFHDLILIPIMTICVACRFLALSHDWND